MPLPFTKSQIERLGRRLTDESPPVQEDLEDLAILLTAYDEVLDVASSKIRDLGLAPTGRLKNTGTILEKLRRHGGSWLKSIQDLAGLRVVIDGGLQEQDHVAGQVVRCFEACSKPPKVIDRRDDPRQGYRAVHVIVFPEGIPVEVQVRTRPQHAWAELFEKLADLIGREIRYGEEWFLPSEREVQRLMGLDPELDAALGEARDAIDEAKGRLNRLINVFMRFSTQIGIMEERLDDPDVDLDVLENLQELYRDVVDELRPVIELVESDYAEVRARAAKLMADAEGLLRVRSKHD